ncbi:hypothetical protein EDB86DRAFT_2087528 [Lactarius hatsudake]|nr:hypothetical protein EDB86DRAFT_2087528 [Lactarius hatsudake]
MNPSQGNSREYHRQAIDDEIRLLVEEYIRALRTLRHRRNALAPISPLPSEILATIVSFLRLPTSDTSPLGKQTDYRLSWLHVAHVCHEWRERYSLVPSRYHYIWRHMVLESVRSKTNSRCTSPTYATLQSAQNPPVFRGYSKSSCHLLQLSNTFHCPAINMGEKGNRWSLSLSLSLFSMVPPLGSHASNSGTATSVGTWKSPLFRGLKHLKISRLSADARPRLSFWLDALDEIPQLMTLALHSASPTTSSFPFDVERIVTLPSLTHLDISASSGGCRLILAHLVLPALTSLCLTAFSRHRNGDDVQRMLPYIARHAHRPQDSRPLQSTFIQCDLCSEGANILAWPAPDIDVKVQDLPNWSCTTLSPRVKLSIRSKEWSSSDIDTEVLRAAMEALPLDNLVMTAQRIYLRCDYSHQTRHLPEGLWVPHILKWSLLQRVRLGISTEQGFITMLLEYNGERGSPLLPSLTELVLECVELENRWTLRLCDALMRRVEQGVPLEILDLRACWDYSPTAVPLLSEIVVDVLGPVENFSANKYMWDPVVRGLDLNDYYSGVEDVSDTGGDE